MALSAHWKNHIEAWQQSGLSQAAYCRQQGLNPNTLAARLHEWRAAGDTCAPSLIPVQVTAAPVSRETLVLQGARGYRLELPSSVSAAWVAELLQCLG